MLMIVWWFNYLQTPTRRVASSIIKTVYWVATTSRSNIHSNSNAIALEFHCSRVSQSLTTRCTENSLRYHAPTGIKWCSSSYRHPRPSKPIRFGRKSCRGQFWTRSRVERRARIGMTTRKNTPRVKRVRLKVKTSPRLKRRRKWVAWTALSFDPL